MAFLFGGTRQYEIKKNKTILARINHDKSLITHHHIPCAEHTLHYVSSPNINTQTQAKSTVVFVHGTPGSWASFSRYFENNNITNDFSIHAIDRPGWGESGYDKNQFPYSLSEQSRLIGPMLEAIWKSNNQHKVLLVGHSLGGSLVPKLAVDYPQYVKGVIVLAGDLDPELSEARWFNKAMTWLPEFCFPKSWVDSNKEVLAIQPSLADLQVEFSALSMPISVLQGSHDGLVRPENAAKASAIFSSAEVEVIMLDGASHIINLTHVSEVKDAITNMFKKCC
ncbi:alpha/beta hydrolase [Marinomonas sp. 5E14-1]|uniref:alpha/beta fold hydrolase n=1 Tax=Marinomonas sp. 5E14-1 TaxID=3153922 RepID=UPI0032630AE9